MNLLFDQNISFKIISKIEDIFPNAKQVKDVGLMDRSDLDIWNFAKNNNYCIVTFDSDFYDLSLVKGTPPKIIWLRVGNMTTDSIKELIRSNHTLIEEFLANPDYQEISCLEIDK